MTTIVVYSPIIDPWFLFVARACRQMGVHARLLTLPEDIQRKDTDSIDCLNWLKLSSTFQVERISPANLDRIRGDIVFLMIRGNHDHNERNHIRVLAKNFTRSIGFLRFSNSSMRWQVKQLIREPFNAFYSLFSEIWTEDITIRLLTFFVGKPHKYFGILPSQRCSMLDECWSRLEQNLTLGAKEYLFSYAGSANSQRDSFADWVESRLNRDESLINLGLRNSEKVIWHYDRAGSQRPRLYEAYLNELESAWFCLCLPGYTGTSNRVLESVLRGSIPVLPREVIVYHCLPFINNVNSVFVYNNNWINAVYRISKLSLQKRLSMQENVIKLARTQACLQSLSQRLVANIAGFSPAASYSR